VRQDFGPLALTMTAEKGEMWASDARRLGRAGYRATSLVAERALGRARFSLGATYLDESATILGGRFSPALSTAGARSWFADAAGSLDLGAGWTALASYRRGWTSVRGRDEPVTGGRLSSQAFAVDLARRGVLAPGDQLAFRIMQPLRVGSGGLDVDLPVSYDHASGAVGYQHRRLDLAPTGRERVYEIAYGTRILGGTIAANAYVRTDPGNLDWMRNDVGGAMRFTLGF
jgi:hypothetical protein